MTDPFRRAQRRGQWRRCTCCHPPSGTPLRTTIRNADRRRARAILRRELHLEVPHG